MECVWKFSNTDPENIRQGGNFTDYQDQKLVDFKTEDMNNGNFPLKLYGKTGKGCNRINLNSRLEAGTYQLTVFFKEPAARIDFFIFLDGRMIATNTVYFSRKQLMGKVEHRYDLICSSSGEHNICIELPRAGDTDELEVMEVALYRTAVLTNSPEWGKERQGRLFLDIWGWQAPLTYARSHPVDVGYYKTDVIKQSAKWGANLVHYWNWSGEESIHELMKLIHEHDFIYDEHWFPPRYPQDLPVRNYRIESTLDRMRIWSDNVMNAARNGWMGAGDGWIPEEKGKGADGACSNSENMIRANHTIWNRNPGAYLAVFTNRPNEDPMGDRNTTEVYKGPNFIYAVSTHQGLGIDDKFSQRLFFGNTAFKNEYNDMYLYLQGECRPVPHRASFGGRADPDFWLKQLCDFFRPRAKDPKDIHESGIFWMLENDLGMPEELREYVYAITVDPIRAAVATRLTSTGMNGSIWNMKKVARIKGVVEEYAGPAPREEHPASTSFIQNNYLRFYRYALGDKGVLLYDTEQLAHYDSNSMSISLSDSLFRTVPSKSNRKFVQLFCEDKETKILEDLPVSIGREGSSEIELFFIADTGTYMLSIEQPASEKSSLVRVTSDDMEAGIYKSENIYKRHEIPLYVYGNGKHIIKLELDFGEGHDIDLLELENTCMKTEIVKSIGEWNNSHEELQHNVTKGIGGYEYGEFHYPYCYFDLDEEMPSEFPAGLAYGFPNPLNLDFSANKGAYLLAIGAKARLGAGSLVSVGLNPDAGMVKHPDYIPQEMIRYCGEYEIPGDGQWHKRVVPVNLYMSGKNRLQLGLCLNGREGHFFDALEIIKTPVKHEYVEYGGHKAVMEEEFALNLGNSIVKESRRYRMYNDTPYFMTTIRRDVQGSPQELSTQLNCEGYGQLVLNGMTYDKAMNDVAIPETIVLRDNTGLRPDMVIHLLEAGSLATLDWDGSGRLSLNSTGVVKEKIRIGIAITSINQVIGSLIDEGIFAEDEDAILLPEEMIPLELKNTATSPLIKVVKIANPGEGPYLIEEKDWWTVRGGQTSREDKGADYLKIYLPANGAVKVQRYGYINGIVKPGYGCQHTIALKDVVSNGEKASCTVKVLSVTPALFAPRIQFSRNCGKVRVNGEGWSYTDDNGLVLLPNIPGEYTVESVGNSEIPEPHISRSGAVIKHSRYIKEEKCLELVTELPPWVRKLPEDQLYMGLINYNKDVYMLTAADGAKVVNSDLCGDIISFKPGTVKVYFIERI